MPTILVGFFLPWTWDIFSWLLQQSTAIASYLGRGVAPIVIGSVLLEITGEITPKNEGMEPKQKQHLVVDGTGDRSKVRC